jgi:uncharacterized delta-60 repeat protein
VGFAADAVDDMQVLGVVRQPDGQVVAVGRKQTGLFYNDSQLAVFRLQPDGSVDTTFADHGLFTLPTEEYGNRQSATSVVLDPDDGRIVVAGSRGRRLIVLRLLPDGSLDSTFGKSGIFAGPENLDYSFNDSPARTSILQTDDGGYRLTASNGAGCQIVALTASGQPDRGFGSEGIATAEPRSGRSTFCNSVAMHADERLVVVGRTAGRGFAARVLANGQPDVGFSDAVVADGLTEAMAVAVSADNEIAVAGESGNGAAIMRLQAGGELDVLFGRAGVTLIDLHTEFGSWPVVHDMKVRADGSLVAAGGTLRDDQAFAVRLLPDNGGGSPGVLGIVEQWAANVDEGSELTFNVRRTGGSSGLVSVEYEISDHDYEPATIGTDLNADTGTLTWADRDTGRQEIRFSTLEDDLVEGAEYFTVILRDAQGGAGLGTARQLVEIAADGSPHGQIGVSNASFEVAEGQTVQIGVSRQWYSQGDVSVTLTPVADTASAGTDFTGDPVTLSWEDGDTGSTQVTIPIVDDDDDEGGERFTIELSNPTGGAILSSQSTAEVNIFPSDRPTQSGGGGGGGALGFLSLLLLGFASLVRRTFRAGPMGSGSIFSAIGSARGRVSEN